MKRVIYETLTDRSCGSNFDEGRTQPQQQPCNFLFK